MDQDQNEVMSLTELAMSMNMATAVMSTDNLTGATPSGFSAHTDNRNNSDDISRDQLQYIKDGGILLCGLNSDSDYQTTLTDTLALLENDPDGFFMMYEEGHIDKWAHKMNVPEIFNCVVRFNQVIGLCMEHAFYNPDTLVLITADHETGGLTFNKNGDPVCKTDGHTPANVPIFAYGQGAEVFADYNDENNRIPMELAKLWGINNFGDQ
jgi:alkaline phosphatase